MYLCALDRKTPGFCVPDSVYLPRLSTYAPGNACPYHTLYIIVFTAVSLQRCSAERLGNRFAVFDILVFVARACNVLLFNFLARASLGSSILHVLGSATKEICCPHSTNRFSLHTRHTNPPRSLCSDKLSDGDHGSIPARFFDIAA